MNDIAASGMHYLLVSDIENRMLGYCYLNFRHPDRARAAFGQYLELDPDDPVILDVLKDDSRIVKTPP